MLIFLYGPDTYRSAQKLKEIISHYQNTHKSGFNFKLIEAEKLDFQEFRDVFLTQSMFKEKKLIVLENASLNKVFKEKFLKEIKGFLESPDIILFYEKEKVSSDKLFNKLKKVAKCQEFNFLEGLKLRAWVKKELKKDFPDSEIEPAALDLIVEYVGSDLWRMANEIKKLANYSQKIKIDNIENLVKPKVEADIFKTIDAIALNNKKQALSLIFKHLEKGDSPLYLLAMINFQFRNLILVKSAIDGQGSANYSFLAGKLGLHPFVVKKTISQAEKFNLARLKEIYKSIFEADLSIKTGKIDPKAALELFISRI